MLSSRSRKARRRRRYNAFDLISLGDRAHRCVIDNNIGGIKRGGALFDYFVGEIVHELNALLDAATRLCEIVEDPVVVQPRSWHANDELFIKFLVCRSDHLHCAK